jgi:hypothetical protein
MPGRITSQKLRHMILTTGDPLDPGELPEKLALFNEEGEPLYIGLQGVRASFDHTTSVLVTGATETGSVNAFPGWRVIRLETNRPARVRLYPTIAQRDADLGRGIGIKPKGNSGRLLEVVSYLPDGLIWDMNPTVDLASMDKSDPTFFSSVTNLDSVTGHVVTTYTYVRTE